MQPTLKSKSPEREASELYLPKEFESHWAPDLDEEIYHSTFAVGSSDLRLILDSPKAFQWGFLKGYSKEQTDAMRLGKLIHLAVLEGSKFRERYAICPDFGDMRSSTNRSKKSAWVEAQSPETIITTESELEMLIGILNSIMDHQDGSLLFKNGRPEVSGFYRDPETGIACKLRTDFLTFNSKILTDLKSTINSRHRKFGSSAFGDRYDLQMAYYKAGIKAISNVEPEVVTLVAVEKKWPYEVAMYVFYPEDLVQGEIDYHRALRRLDACIKSNKWPQRQERIERIYTPRWFIDESVEDESV